MRNSKTAQNFINHIALVLDASSSMTYNAAELIKVADAQIAYLAQRSKELGQETRITVYVFATEVQCVIYDKDVLRLPSIAEHYEAKGMTALIDATNLSLDDLAMTPEKYGDHAFLVYVLTDGQENVSHGGLGRVFGNDPNAHRAKLISNLATRLNTLPEHWTVAVLVPDMTSKHEVKRFGFPNDNIAIWDANSVKGVTEAGSVIKAATDRFMEGRVHGIRGSRSVFSTDATTVNAVTIQQADLKPLVSGSYILIPVPIKVQIREFVTSNGFPYVTGRAFYQLSKTEKIQPQKQIAVVDKTTAKVYTGPEARALVGLPDMHVSVKPDYNKDYDIFVQSTSVNRNLMPGTRLLLTGIK